MVQHIIYYDILQCAVFFYSESVRGSRRVFFSAKKHISIIVFGVLVSLATFVHRFRVPRFHRFRLSGRSGENTIKNQVLPQNDQKIKVLGMRFSIVENLSGPQGSILNLFRGPYLNSRKQNQKLVVLY